MVTLSSVGADRNEYHRSWILFSVLALGKSDKKRSRPQADTHFFFFLFLSLLQIYIYIACETQKIIKNFVGVPNMAQRDRI